MFYNLLSPLATDISLFNVFRYITFRSMAALVTALVLSIVCGPHFIAWLRRLKCGQYILEDVPAHAAKAGTPTMGGLLIMFTLGVSVLLWADLTNPYIWQTLLVFVGFGAVGFWDDMTKLRHHQNKGISPAPSWPDSWPSPARLCCVWSSTIIIAARWPSPFSRMFP